MTCCYIKTRPWCIYLLFGADIVLMSRLLCLFTEQALPAHEAWLKAFKKTLCLKGYSNSVPQFHKGGGM